MLGKSGFIDVHHQKTGMKLFLLYKSPCVLLTMFSHFFPRYVVSSAPAIEKKVIL